MEIISGTQKNKRILTTKGLSTRPTSSRLRETLFNICQQEIQGASFLDLFAGSGAIGLEALSRGAESAVFVDYDRDCVQCIQRNIKEMGFGSKARVINGDVLAWMGKLGSFDLIYVDPPYTEKNREMSYSSEVLKGIAESKMLKPGGMLFMEESKRWKSDLESLNGLVFKNERRIGRAMLYLFICEE